jgi:hypothetical protein
MDLGLRELGPEETAKEQLEMKTEGPVAFFF